MLIAVALVALGMLALPAGASERRPVVRIVDERPVTVAGHAFARAERVTVRVTVFGEQPFAKTVTASAAGRFTAIFRLHSLPECGGYVLTATGNRGSRATLRRFDPPAPCGIDPQP
ncbi:MAG: hypothetical protein ACRDN6_15175 [Gaiellaceae bacterium]